MLLLADLDESDHGLACTKSLATDEKVKILGIRWNPSLDVFQIDVSLDDRVPETKRSILSAIAKLYDPLGWVTPLIISTKIFMQSLWREGLAWDSPLPSVLLNRWRLIYSRLTCCHGVRLPRWVGLSSKVGRTELHGFADASNLAYAAVVYLKVISDSGEVTITLLAGKSKVAPLKPLSIPRLELSAALLLTRLLEFIRSSLRVEISAWFCWTDSTIVLAWLRQHPSWWKTFVANRVAEVQSRFPTAEWRHVPTEENPADCASRGLFGNELIGHALWWHGPPWLRSSPNHWPPIRETRTEDVSIEARTTAAHHVRTIETFDLASRYSSWPKLVRITAYLFRFLDCCRRPSASSQGQASRGIALTANEFERSRTFWIKYIQRANFPVEIHALSHDKHLSTQSSILTLNPFLDHDGVLRVGGRLKNSPLPYSARHPALLASHPLTQLIVEHTHKKALHAGVQLTLTMVRGEFWILRARSLVKAVIHKCLICARERAEIPAQLMGDIPAVRVTAPPRSFAHCGLDYAGPVQVRASAGRGITSRKAYIALFVCLASRAIHLELASDYSTSAFLNAFTRFCSRRGLPQSMYSDNGTTFVGANRELKCAYQAAVRNPEFQSSIASDNVSWHFIPSSAPHFGGIWEAGVRSVKHHLRRVLGDHTLTIDEFTTVLCKVEACLNSRPIAPLTDTLDDYEPLTPGHFLIGSAITVPPEPSLLDLKENRLTRWQLVRQITERFWKLWSTDYVNTLQQRSKWRRIRPPITIGQLVLLRNPNLPPCKWELGRVTDCHPGADGLTRVVTVKTATSEYKRPIVKLCVLPVHCETSK